MAGLSKRLVLPLMDGLRNGPYRTCHTASGDVSMGSGGRGCLCCYSRLHQGAREAVALDMTG